MKIYILSEDEYSNNHTIGVYDSWVAAYDKTTLNNCYLVEVWELNSNTFHGFHWIVKTHFNPYRHEYNPQYSRDIDPTEVQR